MIIKITDGEMSHFIEFSGHVQVHRVPSMRPEDWGDDCDFSPESTAGWLNFITEDEDEEPELDTPGVVIRPEGLPLRTYLTNMDTYLMSDKGRTVEVLNRCCDETFMGVDGL